MDRIKEIWNQLSVCDALGTSGIRKIRFSEESPCDLFLGIKTPENERMLAVRAHDKFNREYRALKNTKTLSIETLSESNDGRVLLCLTLKIDRYHDVFDILIQDIILHILELDDEKKIVKGYIERVAKWQSFFERIKPDGLSPEQQHGLYGELVLLKKLLERTMGIDAIKSWVGANRAIQDFQYHNWAIEVKTSCGKNHQKIQISNERQLDESIIDNLFLFHVSIDVRQGKENTLNEIVSDIKDQLCEDSIACNLFCQKLIDSGYLDIHKDLYEESTFQVRDARFYKVEDDFPRLTERDIPPGIGDVTYSINIGDCDRFLFEEPGIYEILNFNDRN